MQVKTCPHPARAWWLISGVAAGAIVIAVGAAGWYYEAKLDAAQDAQVSALATAERRHTREMNNIRREIITRLDRIEQLAIGGKNVIPAIPAQH